MKLAREHKKALNALGEITRKNMETVSPHPIILK